jgi:DNA end-binding protein Ku
VPGLGDLLARKRSTAKSKSRTQRALWNGAISFGLVNIPVEMFTAETHDELDFTMLDKRDFSPIGYKRVSKETGKEVKWDNIVKGYEYEKGRFVVLSDEDLRQANVEATRTIDIHSFVDIAQIPITSYEKPYYLAPERGGEKAYVLLRETLRKTGKVALAQVVIRVRQHLAALLPFDSVITLITLRYPTELRMPEDLDLPGDSPKRAGVTDNEVKMALALVKSMSDDWDPASYHDSYRDDVLAMIDKKIKSGKIRAVTEPPRDHEKAARKSADVIDLMALLKKSIDDKQPKKKRAAS